MPRVLEAESLKKHFVKKGFLGRGAATARAVDGVSFGLDEGEALVLAGESGSGKSTIAKLLLGSLRPDSGTVRFEGADVTYDRAGLARIRAGCQMVHQDPYDSINPRMRIGQIIAEPLEIHGIGDREARVKEVLGEVRLDPSGEFASRHPHMLSGGQRQRVVLARALAPKPRVIIADEPVSMLDVSVRAEMLGLMQELRSRHKISFLYITHDLATARHFGQRIAVLYRGKIVETGPISDVLECPKHPYTQALLDAVSEPDPANLGREKKIRITDGGESGGCNFRPRCPYAVKECATEPELGRGEHGWACHVDI